MYLVSDPYPLSKKIYLGMPARSHSHQAGIQPLGPALARKEAKSWSVDKDSLVVWVLQDAKHVRMVVAQRNRGDLCVDIQEGISIHINNVIPTALVVVGEVDDCVGKLKVVQFSEQFLIRV